MPAETLLFMAEYQNQVLDFYRLGSVFQQASRDTAAKVPDNDLSGILSDAIEKAHLYNPWFIPAFIQFAFKAWSKALEKEKIIKWTNSFTAEKKIGSGAKTVGIIMAGNIPMVGFHDLLCVLASGHNALIKLSLSDEILVPAIAEVLCQINPDYKNRITYADGPLKKFDAIIATGSNNSSRYFDYYFGKYPHIIRKNRNGIAVLTGEESAEDLENLADDIFMYFGLGCRSVAKLYLPHNYDIAKLSEHLGRYAYLFDMHKFRNNYEYQKSILLINNIPHYDNGFLLFKEDESLISPISVLHYEYYHSIEELNNQLDIQKEQIQCIMASDDRINHTIPLGKSQLPELWDYADGVDTMEFLTGL